MMTPENLQQMIEMTKDDIATCLRRMQQASQNIAAYGAKGVKETEAAMADQPWGTSWIQTLECRVEEIRELHTEIKNHVEKMHLLMRVQK